MLIAVLCRFSLFLVKYFPKIDQRHSPGLDRAWLPPSPDEGATATSANEWRCCLDVGKLLTESTRGLQKSLTFSFD